MIKKGKTKTVTKLSFDAEDAGWSSGDEGIMKKSYRYLFTHIFCSHHNILGKGEGEFQLKKSKQSRQVKKMKMKQSASILVQGLLFFPIINIFFCNCR